MNQVHGIIFLNILRHLCLFFLNYNFPLKYQPSFTTVPNKSLESDTKGKHIWKRHLGIIFSKSL